MEFVYYAAISLDGFIATADGGVEWLDAFMQTGEDLGFNDFMSSIDGVVMGSRTYEFALAHGGIFSHETPTWVFTKRHLDLAHESITFVTSSPKDFAEEIAGRGLERIWLMGGGELAESFREAHLIHEYNLAITPRLLGTGIPLLKHGLLRDDLELIESKSFKCGIVQARYRTEPRSD